MINYLYHIPRLNFKLKRNTEPVNSLLNYFIILQRYVSCQPAKFHNNFSGRGVKHRACIFPSATQYIDRSPHGSASI